MALKLKFVGLVNMRGLTYGIGDPNTGGGGKGKVCKFFLISGGRGQGSFDILRKLEGLWLLPAESFAAEMSEGRGF